MALGFDVVSGGETGNAFLRVKARRPARPCCLLWSRQGLCQRWNFALKAGILLFNIESASELRVFVPQLPRDSRSGPQLRWRVNPDVSAKTASLHFPRDLHQHKFGVPIPESARTIRRSRAASHF